jgi:hypothetical protein
MKSVDQRTGRQDGQESQASFTSTSSVMDFILQRWQLYFVVLAGWDNRQQQMIFATLNQVTLWDRTLVTVTAGRPFAINLSMCRGNTTSNSELCSLDVHRDTR